jgi:rod shape-determining protein MreB
MGAKGALDRNARNQEASEAKAETMPTLGIEGKDSMTGETKKAELDPRGLYAALRDPLDRITDAIRAALEHVPPELAADLVRRGMVLSGGGSFLESLGAFIAEDVSLPVRIAESPWNCVVLGCGEILSHEDLSKGMDLSEGIPLLTRGKGEKIML